MLVTPLRIVKCTYSLVVRSITQPQRCQTLTASPWKFRSGCAITAPAAVGPTARSASHVVGGSATVAGQRAMRFGDLAVEDGWKERLPMLLTGVLVPLKAQQTSKAMLTLLLLATV